MTRTSINRVGCNVEDAKRQMKRCIYKRYTDAEYNYVCDEGICETRRSR